MNRLSARTTVFSGATIGLIAGVAIYGAVSSSASDKVTTAVQPATASVAVAPANAAPCAPGTKLEDGVCVVHVERTVVIPAAPGSDSSLSADPSTSGDAADSQSGQVGAETEAESDAAEPADDAAEHAAEPADDAAEQAPDAAQQAPDAAQQAPDAAEHAAENDG